MRSHLFSYRTQKLSSSAPTILRWRRLGKIGSCCIQKTICFWNKSKSHCPLAQSVEHSAVNRSVVSSSLSGAAKTKHQHLVGVFVLCCSCQLTWTESSLCLWWTYVMDKVLARSRQRPVRGRGTFRPVSVVKFRIVINALSGADKSQVSISILLIDLYFFIFTLKSVLYRKK